MFHFWLRLEWKTAKFCETWAIYFSKPPTYFTATIPAELRTAFWRVNEQDPEAGTTLLSFSTVISHHFPCKRHSSAKVWPHSLLLEELCFYMELLYQRRWHESDAVWRVQYKDQPPPSPWLHLHLKARRTSILLLHQCILTWKPGADKRWELGDGWKLKLLSPAFYNEYLLWYNKKPLHFPRCWTGQTANCIFYI